MFLVLAQNLQQGFNVGNVRSNPGPFKTSMLSEDVAINTGGSHSTLGFSGFTGPMKSVDMGNPHLQGLLGLMGLSKP